MLKFEIPKFKKTIRNLNYIEHTNRGINKNEKKPNTIEVKYKEVKLSDSYPDDCFLDTSIKLERKFENRSIKINKPKGDKWAYLNFMEINFSSTINSKNTCIDVKYNCIDNEEIIEVSEDLFTEQHNEYILQISKEINESRNLALSEKKDILVALKCCYKEPSDEINNAYIKIVDKIEKLYYK